jgi:large-conductance mechanosensitive channel
VLLAKKQLDPFLFVLVLFTDCISLLYALLVHPSMTTQHAIFLWCNGAFLILALLIFFMVWLKKRRQKPNQSTQVQMPAPLQQQKHP